MAVLITLAIIFVLLFTNEVWWRYKKKQNELSRKLMHMAIGVIAAFWPFYLSFTTIKILSLAGVAVLVFSKYFNVLKAIHNVERNTWGEVCSAISVGLLAFLTHNKWIYAASILQMALADGLAAVVGSAYGNKTRYKVLGHAKSLVGSLTFFIASIIILVVFKQAGHLSVSLPYLGLVSLVATGLENLGIKGLDNISVPLAALLMISH